MGVRERRQREREELRRAILDTAREIAAGEGWAAVTIRRVAEKIEYSPPVIYEHFSSKEEIVIELMREGFRRMLGEMRAARDAQKDPVDALLAIGQAYWAFSVAHPEMHLGMHGETAFEACMVRPYTASGKNGAESPAPPRHRPFEEVHDRKEWDEFFRTRPAAPPPDEPFPETREIFLTVRDALERALGPRAGDLESLSWKVVTLWGSTHGIVTLAIAGMIPNGREAGGRLVAKMHHDLFSAWRTEAKPRRPVSGRAAPPSRGRAASRRGGARAKARTR
ncbi:MAG TPA: helix-turn-helix domain-containing protein [bacterium]|nr:helix-turn-helix domain-containing protein [bacterium]